MSIKLKYDLAWDFSDGLARVWKDGKFGFIDTSGREVVPCKYDYAWDFHEGMARVELDADRSVTFNSGWSIKVGGKWGYVDKTGREIIPCIYEEAYDFSDGLAKVYLEIRDPDMPETDDPFSFTSEGKYLFIDKTGRVVIENGKDCDIFCDGLARISRDGKTGFVDKYGHEVIPCRFDGAQVFREGMTVVSEDHLLPEDEQSDEIDYYSTQGFIDKTGMEVVPCKYDDANAFHEGLALVKSDGRFGFIDKSGSEVIPLQYAWADDFHDGLACVRKEHFWGFIDKTGREVLNFAEQGIIFAYYFSDGLAIALCEPGGKRGYIDTSGQLVIPCQYDEAHEFHDGRAWVSIGDTGFFIDKAGREMDITCYSDLQALERNRPAKEEPGTDKPADEDIPF